MFKLRARIDAYLYLVRATFSAFLFKGEVCPFLENRIVSTHGTGPVV